MRMNLFSIIKNTWYGVTFQPKEQTVKSVEVDVVWIHGGELIIGECKTNSKELKVEEVSNLLKLAEIMRCKMIVFGALDNFENLDLDVQSLIESSSIPVHILLGTELFDQYPGKSLSFDDPDVNLDTSKEFEKNVKNFLEWENF